MSFMTETNPVGCTPKQPKVSPAPNAELMKKLHLLGFHEVRYDGKFELLRAGDSVFIMTFEAWKAAPEAVEDNLCQAALAWLRRRRS